MPQSVESQILTKIKKAKRGSLFFADNFLTIANSRTAAKALERLTKSGELKRVATGIYTRPLKDPVIGFVTPQAETVANTIAKRDKARIVPTGAFALNKLGLSTQVPLNMVYLTDGAARKIKIGGRTITFKKTAPKNLAAIGQISSLVIQALRTIGKDKVTQQEVEKILQLLKEEKVTHLQHDIGTAPEWIRKIFLIALREKSNE
ncbi:MAG TPA: DUF6088 family protein [Melioribacteraceae bacterium]|nr:DUF6088 family protein [Melioribacteraceae bacterium]